MQIIFYVKFCLQLTLYWLLQLGIIRRSIPLPDFPMDSRDTTSPGSRAGQPFREIPDRSRWAIVASAASHRPGAGSGSACSDSPPSFDVALCEILRGDFETKPKTKRRFNTSAFIYQNLINKKCRIWSVIKIFLTWDGGKRK